jgi:hypothetical protein
MFIFRVLCGNGTLQDGDQIDGNWWLALALSGVPDAKIPCCDCFFCDLPLMRQISNIGVMVVQI